MSQGERKIGFHVPISKGLSSAVSYAENLRCSTMQLFSHNPRSWKRKSFLSSELKEFKEKVESNNISPLFIHTSYLIQLTSGKESIYKNSIESLQGELVVAESFSADYIIVHCGSSYGDKRGAIERMVDAIDSVFSLYEGHSSLLIENTAGGKKIGGDLEEIAQVLGKAKEKVKLGICLDTAHLFQAGYSFSEEGVKKMLKFLKRHGILERIYLLHINDSLTPRGSHIDRHTHIGEGYIGKRGFRNILKNHFFRSLPLIMETPGIGTNADKKNMKRLKEILEEIN